jgi:hypothetical protein
VAGSSRSTRGDNYIEERILVTLSDLTTPRHWPELIAGHRLHRRRFNKHQTLLTGEDSLRIESN